MKRILIFCFCILQATAQVIDTSPRQVGPVVAFASLPSAATYANRSVTVDDCLTLACSAGGGSYSVVLTSDGTNWNPAGGGGGSDVNCTLTRTSSTVLTLSACQVAVGTAIYTFAGGSTATISAGSDNGFFYVDEDGVLTVASDADTIMGSGFTVVTGLTDFPITAVKIAQWTATTGTWDASGDTDERPKLAAPPKFIAGPNITLTQTDDSIEIEATGGSAGFTLPTRVYTLYYGVVEDGDGNAPPLYAYSGPCTFSSRTAGTATFPETLLNYTGQYCTVFPGGSDGDDGIGPLSGTPVPMKAYFTGRRNNTGGDVYIGWIGGKGIAAMGGSTVVNDFVGIRWNSGGGTWECVIRSGGSDSGTPTAISGAADTNRHSFYVDNNAGTANTARCAIDGGTIVTVGGTPTIPTFNAWKFVITTTAATTNFSAGFLQWVLN
jgi:hypothetical protein